MAYKCPKTLGNTGFSGIYAIQENSAATLLQHATQKLQKGIVASGYEVKKPNTFYRSVKEWGL